MCKLILQSTAIKIIIHNNSNHNNSSEKNLLPTMCKFLLGEHDPLPTIFERKRTANEIACLNYEHFLLGHV